MRPTDSPESHDDVLDELADADKQLPTLDKSKEENDAANHHRAERIEEIFQDMDGPTANEDGDFIHEGYD